jgi:hypothetical protein
MNVLILRVLAEEYGPPTGSLDPVDWWTYLNKAVQAIQDSGRQDLREALPTVPWRPRFRVI